MMDRACGLIWGNEHLDGAWSAVTVECGTHNPGSWGSNPLCYRFKVWAFLFYPRCSSSLRCLFIAFIYPRYAQTVDNGFNWGHAYISYSYTHVCTI